MASTSVRIDDQLTKRLEKAAEKLKRSKSWVINDAVREYMEREESKEKMEADTQQALAYIEAGKVLDGEVVLDWLDSWGQENEKNPPKL